MNEPIVQYNILFKGLSLEKLDFKNINLLSNIGEAKPKLQFAPIFDEDNPRSFRIRFFFRIEEEKTNFRLLLDCIGEFSTNEDITEDFKKSSFVMISAPAIAFPYVRSYISTFTLNSGLQPLILPTFNFTNIASK